MKTYLIINATFVAVLLAHWALGKPMATELLIGMMCGGAAGLALRQWVDYRDDDPATHPREVVPWWADLTFDALFTLGLLACGLGWPLVTYGIMVVCQTDIRRRLAAQRGNHG